MRGKKGLAEKFRDDQEGYVRGEELTVRSSLRKAHTWFQETD